ncbi:cell division cycle protein cdt2 [Tricholoma matsutake]|nr:cell division cycle protein cdt2 [Tricholoma matsutake 945]
MVPSSTSSPRLVLENRTNLFHTPQSKHFFSKLPTPPEVRKVKRPADVFDIGPKRRPRLGFQDGDSVYICESDDGDVEMEDIAVVRARSRKSALFQKNTMLAMRRPGSFRQHGIYPISTGAILQSFVSSNKSDLYKCQSTDINAYLTPPYACSYTHGAKSGGIPVLAVATEQGSVHLINTSKRNDWDFEPPRTFLQPHHNGIFDIKWSTDDALLATCSGDQSTRILCSTTKTITHTLQGHTSTLKCIAWDPQHRELLSSGGRDGTICIWDLRTAGQRREDSVATLNPVITLQGAHENAFSKGKGRVRRKTHTARSITNLLYPDIGPYGLVSSGSFDGILRYWDLRQPTSTKKTKAKPPSEIYSSTIDPTILHGSPRPRGIVSLAKGTGPTTGLVFALGADSRVHTYALPSLTPQKTEYTHSNMQTNSFYIALALSPCGRWLASGGTGKQGSTFLFDVSNAARPSSTAVQTAVELRAQLGEVGAVDWASNTLATCADDGTVRVWRQDIETYRTCQEQPDEKRWDWSWAMNE